MFRSSKVLEGNAMSLLEDTFKKATETYLNIESASRNIEYLKSVFSDHERRICKLEGSLELNVTKVEKIILEKLLEIKDRPNRLPS